MAYALGLAVCGVLTAGVYFTPRSNGPGRRCPRSLRHRPVGRRFRPASWRRRKPNWAGTRWLGSTNPVTAPQTGDTLFLTPEPRATPALFLEN